MNKIVIADAGPLIAFARLHRLDLLPRIFSRVMVTDTVLVECAGRSVFSEGPLIRTAVTQKQLVLCTPPDFSAFVQEIDAGEASAIAMAIEYRCGVLMDDKVGRRTATHLGIPVIGSVGALVLAKRKGLVPLVKPLLMNLVTSGYFLSEAIVTAALAASGE